MLKRIDRRTILLLVNSSQNRVNVTIASSHILQGKNNTTQMNVLLFCVRSFTSQRDPRNKHENEEIKHMANYVTALEIIHFMILKHPLQNHKIITKKWVMNRRWLYGYYLNNHTHQVICFYMVSMLSQHEKTLIRLKDCCSHYNNYFLHWWRYLK